MRTLGERASGFQAIGKIEHAIEQRHLRGADRVLFDRGEHVRIVHAETLLCDCRAERCVKYDWILAFESIDRHPAQFALVDQSLCRIQPRQIVQHPREPRFPRVHAMALRKNIGAARDTHDVFVAMTLSEMLANASREVGKLQCLLRY
jgi:hypothetical protein